jgi:hypothetical protein
VSLAYPKLFLVGRHPESMSWRCPLYAPRPGHFVDRRAQRVQNGSVPKVEHTGQQAIHMHDREGILHPRNALALAEDGTDLQPQRRQVGSEVQGVEAPLRGEPPAVKTTQAPREACAASASPDHARQRPLHEVGHDLGPPLTSPIGAIPPKSAFGLFSHTRTRLRSPKSRWSATTSR